MPVESTKTLKINVVKNELPRNLKNVSNRDKNLHKYMTHRRWWHQTVRAGIIRIARMCTIRVLFWKTVIEALFRLLRRMSKEFLHYNRGWWDAPPPPRTMADRSRLTSQQQQQQPNLTFGYHRRTYASTFIFELRAHNAGKSFVHSQTGLCDGPFEPSQSEECAHTQNTGRQHPKMPKLLSRYRFFFLSKEARVRRWKILLYEHIFPQI